MKKILFVASEALPFASSGGLGDVIGSLPAAIAAASAGDCDVRVVLPLYGQFFGSRLRVAPALLVPVLQGD